MSREMKKRGKKSGFTLIEIFVAMTILTVLISVAMVGYQGYRDRVAVMVDETNQKVLQAALKLFAYDNNALPGSLSDLRPRDLHRAYALVTEGKRSYTMLAHLQVMWQETVGVDVAEAQLPPRYYNNDIETITCLSDRTPPPAGVSYGLNLAAAGRPLRWLLDEANGGVVLIIETDTRGSGTLALRHGGLDSLLRGDPGGKFSVSTTVRGRHHKDTGSGPGGGKGGGRGGGGRGGGGHGGGDDDDDDDHD